MTGATFWKSNRKTQRRENSEAFVISISSVRRGGPLPWLVGAGLSIVTLGLTSCATPASPPAPIDPAASATAYSARNLSNEGLHQFLAQNMTRPPAAWPPESWDFESLSWAAFYYHPSLDVARAAWSVARAAQMTASARPNPSLILSPGFASDSGPDSPWFPGIGADIPFETGNRRALRSEAARLASEASRQDLFAAAWKVRAALHQALIDENAAEARVGILQRQVTVLGDVVNLLNQRLEAGAIAAPEVADARLTLVRARADLADTQAQLPIARQRVAVALGVPVGALADAAFDLSASPSLSDAQVAAAKSLALRTRPDVLAALARFDAARAEFETEAARRIPNVSFGPAYQWDQGTNKWSLDVSVELPIFNRNEGPLAEAEARSRQAAADMLALQADIVSEIDGARAEQLAATAAIPGLQAVQDELQQRLLLLQSAQLAGAADGYEVLSLRAEVLADGLSVLDATTRASSAAARLEDALQIPFGSLEAVSTQEAAAARDSSR